eukprot:SAG22_NODE_7032_length_783_cov_2.706140_1_plen_79_part_10
MQNAGGAHAQQGAADGQIARRNIPKQLQWPKVPDSAKFNGASSDRSKTVQDWRQQYEQYATYVEPDLKTQHMMTALTER